MEDSYKKLKKNAFTGILYQIVAVISAFILPQLFIRTYGSEVNGLINSIGQFLSFIELADMGMGAVISSALYAPLAARDDKIVSRIMNYAKKFYGVIGIILVGYVLALSLIFPFLAQDSFSVGYTVTLLWAMSLSQFGEYFVGISNRVLLDADQKTYIRQTINIIARIMSIIVSVAIIRYGGSIQDVQLFSSIIFLIQPVFMSFYVKRHYSLSYNEKADGSIVSSKRSGIIQHLAYMIYGDTDVAVLTIFSDFSSVSIYSVYALVNNGIRAFIMAFLSGYQAMFGNIIANNDTDRLHENFDFFEWLVHVLVSLLFTVTGILIVPFVLTYTHGVRDANYRASVFAVFITTATAFSSVREAMYMLIKAAGHYKQTMKASLAEALINLGLSVILVFKLNLTGVAIGTLIASSFYVIYEMVYLSKNIVKRSINKVLKLCIDDGIVITLTILLTSWVRITEYSYIFWLKNAVIVFAIALVISVVVQILFYKENVMKLLGRTKNAKN